MFKINDNVKINNMNLTGKIIRIKQKDNINLYTVHTTNNSNIIISESNLSYYIPNNTKNKVSINYSINNTTYTNELMIRHQTVEVALENLDRFISQSICNKEKRIKIIHGRNGGILRKAVHNYLKQSPFVQKFELGDHFEGSYGVTIAYLK